MMPERDSIQYELIQACETHDLQKVKDLLQQGAQANKKGWSDTLKEQVLPWKSLPSRITEHIQTQQQIIEELFKHGATPNVPDFLDSPLTFFLAHQYLDLFDFSMTKGGDIDLPLSKMGSLTNLAASTHHFRTLKTVLAYQPDLTLFSENGSNALHYWCQNIPAGDFCRLNTDLNQLSERALGIKLLIEQGVDVWAYNTLGQQPSDNLLSFRSESKKDFEAWLKRLKSHIEQQQLEQHLKTSPFQPKIRI